MTLVRWAPGAEGSVTNCRRNSPIAYWGFYLLRHLRERAPTSLCGSLSAVIIPCNYLLVFDFLVILSFSLPLIVSIFYSSLSRKKLFTKLNSPAKSSLIKLNLNLITSFLHKKIQLVVFLRCQVMFSCLCAWSRVNFFSIIFNFNRFWHSFDLHINSIFHTSLLFSNLIN